MNKTEGPRKAKQRQFMDREWTKLNKINLSLRSMVEGKKGAGADKRHKLAVREMLGSL